MNKHHATAERPPHLEVSFGTDRGHSKRWNRVLSDYRGRSLPIPLPERALDDAVFEANELRNFGPLQKLQEIRETRSKIIHDHFKDCARILIEEIEAEEGWEDWLSRLGGE